MNKEQDIEDYNHNEKNNQETNEETNVENKVDNKEEKKDVEYLDSEILQKEIEKRENENSKNNNDNDSNNDITEGTNFLKESNEDNIAEEIKKEDIKIVQNIPDEKNNKIIELYQQKLENEEMKKMQENKENKNNKLKMRDSITQIFKESPSVKPKVISEIKKKSSSEDSGNKKEGSGMCKYEKSNHTNKNKNNKNTLKEGSLLRLFRCEYFDTHLHIRYLYDRKEVGVHEYLVNSLYSQRKYEDILFYLPQLSQISLVRYETSSLYRFLLDKASKSMHFALKLCWLYHSIVEDNSSKYKDLAQKMIQEIEMAVVNCKPLNNECKSSKNNKQSYLLDLATPLLFKRKYLLQKIRINEKLKKIKQPINNANKLLHSFSLREFMKSNPIPPEYLKSVKSTSEQKGNERKEEKKKDSNKSKDINMNPKLPASYIINSGSLSIARAKVKLPSTYSKLGNPLSMSKFMLPDVNYSFDMIEELQQFFMKQRRCDYFSLLNNFINLIISVSNLLASEPDIDLRNELLNRFIQSLNSWMVMRRCIVASCENLFTMSGLCIPLENLSYIKSENSDIADQISESSFSYNNLQILQFIQEECKIFFSKKRAPYLLVFEVADLDEDISSISDTLFSRTNKNITNVDTKKKKKKKEGDEKEEEKGKEKEEEEKEEEEEEEDESRSVSNNNEPNQENLESGETDNETNDEEIRSEQNIHSRKNEVFLRNYCYSKSYDLYADSSYTNIRKRNPLRVKKKKLYEKNNVHANYIEDLDEYKKKKIEDRKDLCKLQIQDLYVYKCVVEDLKKKNLVSSSGTATTSTTTSSSLEENNLSIIKKCIGLETDEEKNLQKNKEEIARFNLKKTEHVNPRSVSMPTYVNNSSSKFDAVSKEMNASETVTTEHKKEVNDDISIEKNIEESEKYEKMKRKTSDSKFIQSNSISEDLEKKKKESKSSTEVTKIQEENEDRKNLQEEEKLLDINEYFKPENYLNEDFKKKNCKIIKKLLWGELFEEKKKKFRKNSPYGKLNSWDLKCVIVKGGDDLRQELLASQLIKQFKNIFDNAGLPLWLRPYEILVTGASSGIIEYVNDTCSVDSLKRKFATDNISTIFNIVFADYIFEAKKNFIESHAAYSLISYLLQVKDRHNGNMLLDSEGHLIHIDYGFMLTNSPGNVNFETSPFKLTQEYLDIMDGEKSDNYEYFRRLIISGFLEARKHSDEIVLFVELMMPALKMPCFSNGAQFCIESLKERFMTNLTVDMCVQRVNALIEASVNNFRSVQYDYFQRITNGIM